MSIYGEELDYFQMEEFIKHSFMLDDLDAKLGCERYATALWSKAGQGKTSLVQQFSNKPVLWKGTLYPGWKISKLPLAQIEEVGDLLGLPRCHVSVSKEGACKWVSTDVLDDYRKDGWVVNQKEGVRMLYGIPDWVPTEPGPSILIFDDWNKTNQRIIKAIMQLLQEHKMISWSLPEGCHIVLTGNPEGQEYSVTTLDPSVLQRIRSATLKFDVEQWSIWAERNSIHTSIIAYVNKYPEMITGGKEKTSPRSISEFGRYLTLLKDIKELENKSTPAKSIAHSVLDSETVDSFLLFLDRDYPTLINPEDILRGDKDTIKKFKQLYKEKEKRIDVISLIVNRLYCYMVSNLSPSDLEVENFRLFIKEDFIEQDMRYVFIARLHNFAREQTNPTNRLAIMKWYNGDKELTQKIMEMV